MNIPLASVSPSIKLLLTSTSNFLHPHSQSSHPNAPHSHSGFHSSSPVTSLQPFLPPILLSSLYHLFPLSSLACFFHQILFCTSSLFLSLPLFAPSVFVPQGVLSQSEANLPNYKPHRLSLLHTHTHTRISCIHRDTYTHISSLSHTKAEAQIHSHKHTHISFPYFHCLFQCFSTNTHTKCMPTRHPSPPFSVTP